MRHFPTIDYQQTLYRVRTDSLAIWGSAGLLLFGLLAASVLLASQISHPLTIQGQGRVLRLRDSLIVTLEDDSTRVLAKVYADHGQRVKKGALLFETRSSDAEQELTLEKNKQQIATQKLSLAENELKSFGLKANLRLDVAKAKIAAAQTALAVAQQTASEAQQTLERTENLARSGHAVDKELEEQQITLDEAKLLLRERRLELLKARQEHALEKETLEKERLQLERALVEDEESLISQKSTVLEKEVALRKNKYYAPIDGIVGWTEMPQIGKTLENEASVLTITPHSVLAIEASYGSQEVDLITKGMAGEFSVKVDEGKPSEKIPCRVVSHGVYRVDSKGDMVRTLCEPKPTVALPAGKTGTLELRVRERTALQAAIESVENWMKSLWN